MDTKDIRPGARFRICGTVESVTENGNYVVTLDGGNHINVITRSGMGLAELLYLPPQKPFTKEQSALIRERLEAGDLADVLDSLTE